MTQGVRRLTQPVAVVFERKGDHIKASADFNRAVSLDPTLAPTLSRMGLRDLERAKGDKCDERTP